MDIVPQGVQRLPRAICSPFFCLLLLTYCFAFGHLQALLSSLGVGARGTAHGRPALPRGTDLLRYAKRPRQASLRSFNGPGGSPGHEWGAWRGLLALSTSNVWIVHVDSPCGQSTWTSAGDHHLRWLNLQEKVGRGTLDLELSLDSYSGAPRGPRASPGPHLGLQRNVTNLLAQGSSLFPCDGIPDSL